MAAPILGRRAAMALTGAACMSRARADEDTIDMSHAVFVALAGSSRVHFIDPDSDRIAGAVDTGLVPARLELAAPISKLLAIDGKTARLHLADTVSGDIAVLPAAFVPDRITVSPGGLSAALADTASGRVLLLDLMRRRWLGEVQGPASLRDMLFGADSRTLYIAGGARAEVGVVDATTGLPLPAIATGQEAAPRVLTRSADGRRLYVRPEAGGGIAVVDLEQRRALPPIPAAGDSSPAFPSGTGRYLLIADNQAATVSIVREGTGASPAVLPGAPGIGTIYTAWFDTLALAPSSTTHAVLLYDLEAMRPAETIPLPASPARGAVTPDGKKLYLPLPDAGVVAVLDLSRRALVASIAVAGTPSLVLLAGSYGVCH